MEYRGLGQSGLKVSALSIGGWLTLGGSVNDDDAHAILDAAANAGINYIDLADVYSGGESERVAGRWLQGKRRSAFVIASKVFWPTGEGPNDRGLSRKHITESCHEVLRRLGTDYLDVFFCHREDEETPLDETVRAMEDLIRQGKVLYWGTSCWNASTLVRAHAHARLRGWAAPIVEQPRYNLLDRQVEKRVLPVAKRLGMGLVVWSPLAGGALTGKYDEDVPAGSRGATSDWLREILEDDAKRTSLRAFSGLAREAGMPPSQLALAWLLSQDGVSSVITGATRPAQLEENLGALEARLDDDLLQKLRTLFPRE